MIDTETRQPTDIYAIDNGAINNWIVKDKECPIDKGGRVKMSDDAELVRTIDTYYNDVDINGHINSVKYIEHVLDLWPLDWYRTHRIHRFEIAYVAEAHAGDQLFFYKEQNGDCEYSIRIVRSDGTECCRSKVSFIEL
jgi:acyl-ACP thioesterase